MKIRQVFFAATALLGFSLTLALPASATVASLNKCSTTLSKSFQKMVNGKVKLFSKCVDRVAKCSEGADDTAVDACIAAKASVAGGPCSSAVLDPANPATKLGRVIQSFKDKVDGKCKPSDQGGNAGNPAFAELTNATIGASQNSNFATGGLRALQIECDRLGFVAALTSWTGATGLRDCLARLAGKAADEQVSNSNKRAFAALNRTGMAALSDPVPLGSATVNSNVEFRLNVGGLGFDITGFTGTSKINVTGLSPEEVKAVTGLTTSGAAVVTINAEDTHYTPADLTVFGGGTAKICLAQSGRAIGVICCNPADCTAALGSPDYTLNQDHESSGNNAGWAVGEVGAADATCSQAGTIQIAGLTVPISVPCSEGAARDAACNAGSLGSSNRAGHYPRCTEGINARKACAAPGGTDALTCQGACTGTGLCGASSCATSDDVACKTGTCSVIVPPIPCSVTEQCPVPSVCSVSNPCVGAEACAVTADCSSGTCTANSGACRNRAACSTCPTFPSAPPCNSALKFTHGVGTFSNGDVVLATKMEFLVHTTSGVGFTDVVNYPAGCSNSAGDTKPDTYGCDGLPCTSDDTNQATKATVPFLLTTGSASTTIFDSNAIPSSLCPTYSGKIVSQNVGNTFTNCAGTPSAGVVPANACTNLSQNKGTGYELVATFPLLDNPAFGDGAISMRLKLQ